MANSRFVLSNFSQCNDKTIAICLAVPSDSGLAFGRLVGYRLEKKEKRRGWRERNEVMSEISGETIQTDVFTQYLYL